MSEVTAKLQEFVAYAKTLKGDEKGEAQVFLDRLFQGFGHRGYKEAGATLEDRVKQAKGTTKFADLVWRPRLLLEMKSRGEKLEQHFRQAFEYWLNLVPNRPRYVVLCNFDEFWIYDFDRQLDEPVDAVGVEELPIRYTSLNFLFPQERKPIFGNDRVAVTRAAADKVAKVFNALVRRGEDRARAQRFILQCVVALFAEDFELLPRGIFLQVLHECQTGGSAYDLIGGLFRQMNSREPARGGRYKEVPYFNGGLFSAIEPVELADFDVHLLAEASAEDWAKVNPAVFGTLFQASMDQGERHAFGAHFTSEADIMKIVLPTIVRPWRELLDSAKTMKDLLALREELRAFKVLDPACGSGNFLYCAYRELKRIEVDILLKVREAFRKGEKVQRHAMVSVRQMYGLDVLPFAVELTKVTLLLAKELAIQEARVRLSRGQSEMRLDLDPALPLDNLDDNIRCADALFTPWPEADAIIGNPPYLGSRYLAKQHGYEYARKVYTTFPAVPKMADYCVHWFRLAHDHLKPGGRAGLVGTKTIRQNESREASLDYIVQNGGTISEAVAHQVWSGEAAVHVSIVNWRRGQQNGHKRLYTQLGDATDSPWKCEELDTIGPTLTTKTDVTQARRLVTNEKAKKCFTGQNPVNAGFFLTPAEAKALIEVDPKNREVIFPYMIGRDLVENGGPTRWIIDFAQRDVLSAMKYEVPFKRVQERVMPVVMERAEREKKARGEEVTRYTRIAGRWWQFYDYRPGTIAAINSVLRWIACSRTTKRSIFEFVSNDIHADSKLVVFAFADDYSFGILQSGIHWAWVVAKGSTLKGDQNYTSDTVFDTFPWPQTTTRIQVEHVAAAAVALRALRREMMERDKLSLRDLYRSMELPGKHPLKDAHAALDDAVREAYGMGKKAEPLAFLLALNQECAAREQEGKPIVGPGMPRGIRGSVTEDCIRIPTRG